MELVQAPNRLLLFHISSASYYWGPLWQASVADSDSIPELAFMHRDVP